MSYNILNLGQKFIAEISSFKTTFSFTAQSSGCAFAHEEQH